MADTARLHPFVPDSPPQRRLFTGVEMEAMRRAGLFPDETKIELLDGEIWTRPADRAWAASQRRRYTGAELDTMMRAGIIEDGGPEELLDGDIWIMAAEGTRHSRLKVWLNDQLVRRRPLDVTVACDTTTRFADNHRPSPDFALFPARLMIDEARGPDMLLVIEIADSSLSADLKIKGAKYKEYSVREYWVIDIERRVTHVHKLDGAWPETPPVPFDTPITPALLPGVTLRLADCEL